MKLHLRLATAFFVSVGLFLHTLLGAYAEDSVPGEADVVTIQAAKESRPVDFFPHPDAVIGDPLFAARADGRDSADADAGIGPWTLLVGEAPFDSNWEIISARSDGQVVTRITNNGWNDFRPVLNRMATRILYTSERNGSRDLFVMNADGSNEQQLTAGSGSNDFASWLPGERQILFSSNRGGDWGIYTMNADGSNQTLFHSIPDVDSIYPSMSPDGSRIAWVQRENAAGQIWVRFLVDPIAFPMGGSCNYMQNLRWINNDELLGDCDVDGDVMNEIFSISMAQPQFSIVSDANQRLTDTWAGGIFQSSYYANWRDFHLANIHVRYVVEGGNVFVSAIWTEIPGLVPMPGTTLPGMVMRSWQKTDWTPPVTSMLDVRALHFGYGNGDFPQSYHVPFRLKITDIGPALLDRISVYYRVNGGDWQRGSDVNLYEGWQEAHVLTALISGIKLGDQIDVQSIARDIAGNVEDVNQKSLLSTVFYRGRLSGEVTDRMGLPLVGVTYESAQLVDPVGQSDSAGKIRGTIEKDDLVTVNLKHPAFVNQSVAVEVPRHESVLLNVYNPVDAVVSATLYSPVNLLNDGSFEQNRLLDWQSNPLTGTLLTSQKAFMGTKSLQFGDSPAPVTATFCRQSESPYFYGKWRDADLSYDQYGNLHLVKDGIYQQCQGENCSQEERVFTVSEFQSANTGATVRAAGGRVLIAVQDVIDGQTANFLLYERIDGVWRTVFTESGQGFFGFADMHVTEDGDVYLVWAEQLLGPTYEVRLKYRERKGAEWSATQLVHTFPPGSVTDDPIRLRVDTKRMPHIFVMMDKLYDFQQSAPGTWSAPKIFYADLLAYYDIAYDGEGTLHFAYHTTNGVFYAKRVEANWRLPELVTNLQGFFRPLLLVLPEDQVLLLGNQYSLFVRNADGKWMGSYSTHIRSIDINISAISSMEGGVQLASWGQPDYGEIYCLYQKAYIKPSDLSTRSTIQRKFVVPQVFANPTLFFNANFENSFALSAPNRLFVEVDDGQTVHRTLDVTDPTDGWKPFAASLYPWKGQEITLTVGLDFVAENESALLNLDAMQIASWETPEIRDVLIEQVPTGVNTRIVITGENFVDGATLSLGDIPLQNVRVVSIQRIEADLAEFLPGIFPVTVTSPNGIAAVRQALIGRQLYLPLLSR